MIGWLVYDEVGANRNAWFIDQLIWSASKHSTSLTLKIISTVEELYGQPLPDFAIVRTINPAVNKFLEANNVTCFNNHKTSKIANDKFATYNLCKQLNIDVLETQMASEATLKLDFPLVLKSLNGHGGSEVFLATNKDEFDKIFSTANKNNFLAQKLCSKPGVDMRVYVLGDTIILGVLRRSQTDFRSNFSLGGNASVATVTKAQIEVINKLRHALNFDFVGVDFIYHNGDWVLNEIEDVVGTRMIYKLTDIDVVDLYVKYIIDKLKKKA